MLRGLEPLFRILACRSPLDQRIYGCAQELLPPYRKVISITDRFR